MAVPQYLGFRFLPEDRPGLLERLRSDPSLIPIEGNGTALRFRVTAGEAACVVEVGDDHGVLEVVPDEGDAAAALAEEILADGGAVFTTCC